MKASEDPRRIAARRAGGALFNCWPQGGFDGTVPQSFHVSTGGARVICVSGTNIQTQYPLRPGRSFSVREVAGVIVGPCDGSNVLYNRQNEALAQFGMAETNAGVFVRYLRDYGVPFYGLNGEPLLLGGGDSGSHSAHPRQFRLELQQTAPFGMWIGMGLLFAMVLSAVGLPVACALGSRMAGRAITIVLGLSIFSIAAPWIAAAWRGELFPPQLAVDGETIWVFRAFHSMRELPLDEVAQMRYDKAGQSYVLFDQKGKALIKFSPQADFGPEFMDFLKTHNIRPRFDP